VGLGYPVKGKPQTKNSKQKRQTRQNKRKSVPIDRMANFDNSLSMVQTLANTSPMHIFLSPKCTIIIFNIDFQNLKCEWIHEQ